MASGPGRGTRPTEYVPWEGYAPHHDFAGKGLEGGETELSHFVLRVLGFEKWYAGCVCYQYCTYVTHAELEPCIS